MRGLTLWVRGLLLRPVRQDNVSISNQSRNMPDAIIHLLPFTGRWDFELALLVTHKL